MTESESVALPLGDTPLYQPSAGFDTWASWIRTSECRSQSPVPYRLAIAQYTIMQTAERKSARRDSNSRPSPWQGDALPLSHSRIQRLKESNSQFSLWRRTLYHLTKPLYMLSSTNNILSHFICFVNYFFYFFQNFITSYSNNGSYYTTSYNISRKMYSKIQPAKGN